MSAIQELDRIEERLKETFDALSQGKSTTTVLATLGGIMLSLSHFRERLVLSDQAETLFVQMTREGASFWTTAYPLYMRREITRSTVRDIIRKGLRQSHGNYKIVTTLFNIEERDYKRFLNFLRKHDCQVPFKEYRVVSAYGQDDNVSPVTSSHIVP